MINILKIKKNICNKHILALLFFIFLMCYAQVIDCTFFAHDALAYWTTGDRIVTGEGIDIYLFPNTFRGYFLYVLILLFKTIAGILGNPYWGWRFLASALTTIVFVYCIPYLFSSRMHLGEEKKYFIGYLALSCVLCYFFGDLLQRPNSDILSSYFFIISIALLKLMRNTKMLYKKMILGILVGAFSYATYNTRVAYMYSIIFFICMFVISECKKRWLHGILIIPLLIGGLIIAFPQMMINYQYTGKWSPAVNTKQLYGEDYDLKNVQLLWGLYLPRYETYDGNLELYEENGVHFYDPIGEEIIRREGIEGKITVKGLIRLALKYPGDIIGIYVRHFANIMIPLWRESYIMELYTNKFLNIVISMTIWMLAALNWIVEISVKKINKASVVNGVAMTMVVLPAIMQTLGAVEIRFFYLCYILAYYYVCCKIDYKALWANLKGKRFGVLIICIVIGVMWITILGDTLTRNRHTIMLIGDYYSG